MRKVLLIGALLVSGCSEYVQVDVPYATEQTAAVAFYKDNLKVLTSLSTGEEILGWVIKCGDKFYNTTYKIGGTKNSIIPPKVGKECSVVANLHSHPLPPSGYTSDLFSIEDIKSSSEWNMYLLAQENCNVRIARKGGSGNLGEFLGRMKKCK